MSTFSLQFLLHHFHPAIHPSINHPNSTQLQHIQKIKSNLSALHLASEYNLSLWITALLDPAPIEPGSSKDKLLATAHIQSPPKYNMVKDKDTSLQVPDLSASTRARSKRSVSPSKTPRKIASPRKRTARAASAKIEDEVKDITKATKASTKALVEKILQNGDGPEPESSVTQTTVASEEDTVRVEVQEVIEKKGDVEITRTIVAVDVPASHPDLPLPKEPEAIVQTAKEIVTEAKKVEKKSRKRKASNVLDKDQEEVTKKVKTGLEETIRTERAHNRTLLGVSALLAVG
jgi:hypothetical protein